MIGPGWPFPAIYAININAGFLIGLAILAGIFINTQSDESLGGWIIGLGACLAWLASLPVIGSLLSRMRGRTFFWKRFLENLCDQFDLSLTVIGRSPTLHDFGPRYVQPAGSCHHDDFHVVGHFLGNGRGLLAIAQNGAFASSFTAEEGTDADRFGANKRDGDRRL